MDLNYIYDNMQLERYRPKFEMLQKILGNETKVILEIGGHYGEDTLRFHKFFPNTQIYSFEPDPRNIEIFKKTCQNIDNISLIEKAVCDKTDKILDFYMSYKDEGEEILQDKYKYIGIENYKKLKLNNSGSSSLKKSNRIDLINSDKINVNTIRLDDWIINNNIDIIDFIWIDVQGAEKEVIEGCEKVMNRIKYIQLEYGETSYDGGLSKKQTYDMMINNNFELILDYNPNSGNGDFLFKNKHF